MKYNELRGSRIRGIYKVTNSTDGKSYIGQAENLHKRWLTHWRSAFGAKPENTLLYIAMRECGPEAWEFEILEEIPKGNLDKREIYWVAKFGTFGKGYNQTPGGGTPGHLGMLGKNHSQETKQKISAKHKGKTLSPEHIARLRGQKRSEEAKQEMSQAKIGKKRGPRSPEHTAKIALALKGRARTNEFKEKQRLKTLEIRQSPEKIIEFNEALDDFRTLVQDFCASLGLVLISYYESCHSPMRLVCSEDHEFEKSLTQLRSHPGCPVCKKMKKG
jgi:group I intron endonuclease